MSELTIMMGLVLGTIFVTFAWLIPAAVDHVERIEWRFELSSPSFDAKFLDAQGNEVSR